jgi:hypothetical protein
VAGDSEHPYRGLHAAHIFPTSQIGQWERGNYQRYITDLSPDSKVGSSKLYSPQNGLLLRSDIHEAFDGFKIGVDPDVSLLIFLPVTRLITQKPRPIIRSSFSPKTQTDLGVRVLEAPLEMAQTKTTASVRIYYVGI